MSFYFASILYVMMKKALLLLILLPIFTYAQDVMPPLLPWKGKSEALIVAKDHPWITPGEAS
ncbi:hypothetical protein, partial [Algoriphagus sp.]|uniref:hypothetical protein n=1 Tax=Algoriphagus sp. TaxID=1872435 RepID=UPI0025809599